MYDIVPVLKEAARIKGMSMISLGKAKELLFSSLPNPVVEEVPVADSIGCILAENVISTVPMPPFNKSAVDGYACKHKDVLYVPAELKCIGLIEAGDTFKKKPKRGECVKIMTGAAVPEGFDSIIMIEDTESNGSAVIMKKTVTRGENISRKGEDLKKGITVLTKGREINGSEVMIASSMGRRKIRVYRKPDVGVLNTGNEIINPPQKLSGNRIFNSNGPLLVSIFKNMRLTVKYLGIAKDREPILYKKIREGLKHDILIISGGVSVGDYDLVPSVLRKAGVKILFHTVRIKPGKPMLFGIKGKTIVFGLPGNPNANFLACHLFIVPAVKKMMGYRDYELKVNVGFIGEEYHQRRGRKHFVLAKIGRIGGKFILHPVESHGSADVPSLHESDGFMILHENFACFRKGSKVPFITWKKNE